MNSCHFKSTIGDFYDKILSEHERLKLKEHLNECSDCTTQLEQFRQIDSLVQGQIYSAPPEKYWDELPLRISQRLGFKPAKSFIDSFIEEISDFLHEKTWQVAAVGVAALLFILWQIRELPMTDLPENGRMAEESSAPENISGVNEMMSPIDLAATEKGLAVKADETIMPNAIPEARQPEPIESGLTESLAQRGVAGPVSIQPRGLKSTSGKTNLRSDDLLSPLPNTRFIIASSDEEAADNEFQVTVLSQNAANGPSGEISPHSESEELPNYESDFEETLWIVQQSQSLQEKKNIWLSFIAREKNVTDRAQGIYNLALVLSIIAENTKGVDDAREAIAFYQEHEKVIRPQMKDSRYEAKVKMLNAIIRN